MSLSDTSVSGVDHPLARSVVLDLEVGAPGDVRIVNNMADVELSADLRVRGTLADPVLLGSTTVLDGSVVLNDQRYRFLRGSIEFQNPLRTEPHLDIAVETSIRQYLVTINVSGSPARGDVNATFISSPPLSDLQLIQLLTVGDAPDEGFRNQDDSLGAVGAQATSFLTRQYMNQVERGAQRVFGVDRFRVEPSVVRGSGDPTARVTLGKQVTPDLWVSWTSILGTTEEQLVTIEYQLTRGIRVRATREEDGSLGVDFRFDHRFR
jgi:translocation and assembly module TamB